MINEHLKKTSGSGSGSVMKCFGLFLVLSLSFASISCDGEAKCKRRIKLKTVVDTFGMLVSATPESSSEPTSGCSNYLYMSNRHLHVVNRHGVLNFNASSVEKLIINNRFNNLLLSKEFLANLPNLQSLKLLAIVRNSDRRTFSTISELRELKLGVESLEILKSLLDPLKKLERLTIFNSELTISSSLLRIVSQSLKHLEIINSTISVFQPKPFVALSDLVTFKLEHNNFVSKNPIKDNFFYGLNALKRLEIVGHKNITQISKNVFANLPNLRELNLENNAIRVIANQSFSGLHLDILNLRNNPLESIKSGILDGAHVRDLYLQEDLKMSIEEDAFDNCVVENDGI